MMALQSLGEVNVVEVNRGDVFEFICFQMTFELLQQNYECPHDLKSVKGYSRMEVMVKKTQDT